MAAAVCMGAFAWWLRDGNLFLNVALSALLYAALAFAFKAITPAEADILAASPVRIETPAEEKSAKETKPSAGKEPKEAKAEASK